MILQIRALKQIGTGALTGQDENWEYWLQICPLKSPLTPKKIKMSRKKRAISEGKQPSNHFFGGDMLDKLGE